MEIQPIYCGITNGAQECARFAKSTKNYLGKTVGAVKDCGKSVAQTAKSTETCCRLIDQTMYGSYRGFILGGVAGSILTGGFLGTYAGARAGATIGGLLSFLNGVSELAD